MNTILPWLLLTLVTLTWYLDERNDQSGPATLAEVVPPQTEPWQAFELEDLLTQNAEQAGPYLPFLNTPTLRTGLYELPAGGTDRQQPHDKDEVYYIISGQAQFTAEDDTLDVKPGLVLFVAADVDHRFFDIQEDLQVLVFFSEADPEE